MVLTSSYLGPPVWRSAGSRSSSVVPPPSWICSGRVSVPQMWWWNHSVETWGDGRTSRLGWTCRGTSADQRLWGVLGEIFTSSRPPCEPSLWRHKETNGNVVLLSDLPSGPPRSARSPSQIINGMTFRNLWLISRHTPRTLLLVQTCIHTRCIHKYKLRRGNNYLIPGWIFKVKVRQRN